MDLDTRGDNKRLKHVPMKRKAFSVESVSCRGDLPYGVVLRLLRESIDGRSARSKQWYHGIKSHHICYIWRSLNAPTQPKSRRGSIYNANPFVMSVACQKIWRDGHIQIASTTAICPSMKKGTGAKIWRSPPAIP